MNRSVPPKVPPLLERRPKTRRRVLLAGRVSYFDGAYEFACSIKDLSETGARITLARGQPVPKIIALANLTSRVLYKAQIVWNDGRHAGVRFLDQLPAAELTEPHLRRLFL